MKGHGFVCYLLLVYIVYISISYLFLGHLVPFLSPLSEMPPRCQLASSPLEPRFQPRRSSFENECYQHNSTEKADSQASRRIGIDGNGREIGSRALSLPSLRTDLSRSSTTYRNTFFYAARPLHLFSNPPFIRSGFRIYSPDASLPSDR